MGLNARWLVSLALWMFPIAITLGVLFSIDAATGGKGIPKSDGGFPPPKDNTTKTEHQCDVFTGIEAPVLTGHQGWTLTANPWGVKAGEPGGICIFADIHNNQTYGTPSDPNSKIGAPAWSVTWHYPARAPPRNVHGYPNIKAKTDTRKIQQFKKLDLSLSWVYSAGSQNTTVIPQSSVPTLQDNGPGGAQANVALDFFIDPDQSRSEEPDTSKAGKFARAEVMVWFAAYGAGSQPVGKPVTTRTDKNGNVFTLYMGFNTDSNGDLKQLVCTWLPTMTVNTFDDDLLPFITFLNTDDKVATFFAGLTQPATYKVTLPQPTDYIGYMALGTEVYSSADQNVTFTAPHMSFDIST